MQAVMIKCTALPAHLVDGAFLHTCASSLSASHSPHTMLLAAPWQVIDAPTTTSNSGSGASKAAESNNTSSSGSMYPSKGVWAHSFVGTPNYLAPEMVACEGYGFKADVWAAGCVLYEMAALKPAFRVSHCSLLVNTSLLVKYLVSTWQRCCAGVVRPAVWR